MPVIQQPQKREIKGIMDIVICIDATGSMKPCIDALKDNLRTLIQNLTVQKGSQEIKPDWRARVIYFRDLDVDAEALKEFSFVNSEDELRKQIESIKAEGGGDEPESFLDALYTAVAKSQWRDNALHAIIAFTDAPPKEKMHSSTIEPGQKDDVGEVINALLRDKYQKTWIYCPTHYIYKELEKIPNVFLNYVDEKGDVYEGLKNINFPELCKELGKTLAVSASEVIKA